jgi:hypothetical protein
MAPSYTEEDVQRALHAISNKMSIKKARLEYKVPRPTLHGRINGTLLRQKAHQYEQRLSKVQEDHLT